MSMEATIDELRVQGTLNEEIRRQILEAAEARMPRHRTSIAYRFSLAIVALVMVLLPLIYLAIIAGVGWGAWWHTTHNYGMLTASGARGKALFFVALFRSDGPEADEPSAESSEWLEPAYYAKD